MITHYSSALYSLKFIRVIALGISLLACSANCLIAAEVKVELNDEWTFTKGEEYPGADGSLEPGAAEKTLVLSYNFTGGGQYVAAAKALEPSGDLTGVEVTAAGSGGNLGVTLIDDTDQTFIYRLGSVDTAGKTYVLPLSKPSNSYGGANDKTLHFPIKAIRLIVEKSAKLPQGKITFSQVVLTNDK